MINIFTRNPASLRRIWWLMLTSILIILGAILGAGVLVGLLALALRIARMSIDE